MSRLEDTALLIISHLGFQLPLVLFSAFKNIVIIVWDACINVRIGSAVMCVTLRLEP